MFERDWVPCVYKRDGKWHCNWGFTSLHDTWEDAMKRLEFEYKHFPPYDSGWLQ